MRSRVVDEFIQCELCVVRHGERRFVDEKQLRRAAGTSLHKVAGEQRIADIQGYTCAVGTDDDDITNDFAGLSDYGAIGLRDLDGAWRQLIHADRRSRGRHLRGTHLCRRVRHVCRSAFLDDRGRYMDRLPFQHHLARKTNTSP